MYMIKNVFCIIFLIVSSLLFSQNDQQGVAQANYKRQISQASYENVLGEMKTSAMRISQEKINQLNDKFELNFSEKVRFEEKLKSLLQKKSQLESKINFEKRDSEKTDLEQKVDVLNLDIEKIKSKLKKNETDLKELQEEYNSLNK